MHAYHKSTAESVRPPSVHLQHDAWGYAAFRKDTVGIFHTDFSSCVAVRFLRFVRFVRFVRLVLAVRYHHWIMAIPGAAFAAVGPSDKAVATVAMLVPLPRGRSDQILHIFHMFHEGSKFYRVCEDTWTTMGKDANTHGFLSTTVYSELFLGYFYSELIPYRLPYYII